LKAASAAWKTVTTLQPQSRDFGIASLELFQLMRDAITIDPDTAGRVPSLLVLAEARRSVDRGIRNLRTFVSQAHDVTEPCLNSGVLFAPARVLRVNTPGPIGGERRAIVAVSQEASELLDPIRALQPVMRALDTHSTERSIERELIPPGTPGHLPA
jgi:hypothetical protein